MQPLEPPDSFHLSAAQGWLELGDHREATQELGRIAAALQEHPAVVELSWQIAVGTKRWDEALHLAERLCQLAPESAFGFIHRAYCLHELRRTQEAWDALLPLAKTFPTEWLIAYNLACYACQLGRIDDAKSWLGHALEIGDTRHITQIASEDPDLKPLRDRPV